MSKRQDEFRGALRGIGGVDDALARHVAAFAVRVENNRQAHAVAYDHACRLRDRHEYGDDPITFDDAVEAYGKLPVLDTDGPRVRDACIILYLRILDVCPDHKEGRRCKCRPVRCLPITNSTMVRSKKSPRVLSDSERKPCLAWAMEKATGINEATIAKAWKCLGRLVVEWLPVE